MQDGLWDDCALRAGPDATTGLALGEDLGTHKAMLRDALPPFNPFAFRGVRVGPSRPWSPAPFPLWPSSLFNSYDPGAVGKPTAGANPRQRRFGAAMPTPFPWQWAPNGRPPGKAKMPEKSDAVSPEIASPRLGARGCCEPPQCCLCCLGNWIKTTLGCG